MFELERYDVTKPDLADGAFLDPDHWAKPSLCMLFNERSGAIVRDYSGNGFHGAASGAPVWGADGLLFDGVDDRVVITHNAKLSINGDFTVSIDFDHLLDAANRMILSQGGGDINGWYLKQYSSTEFVFSKNGTIRIFNKTGVKQTLDIVYTQDTIKIYKDGSLWSQASLTFPTTTATNALLVANASSSYYAAFVRRLSIYSYALTSEQIKSLYETPYQNWVRDSEVFVCDMGANIQAIANYYRNMRAA